MRQKGHYSLIDRGAASPPGKWIWFLSFAQRYHQAPRLLFHFSPPLGQNSLKGNLYICLLLLSSTVVFLLIRKETASQMELKFSGWSSHGTPLSWLAFGYYQELIVVVKHSICLVLYPTCWQFMVIWLIHSLDRPGTPAWAFLMRHLLVVQLESIKCC